MGGAGDRVGGGRETELGRGLKMGNWETIATTQARDFLAGDFFSQCFGQFRPPYFPSICQAIGLFRFPLVAPAPVPDQG